MERLKYAEASGPGEIFSESRALFPGMQSRTDLPAQLAAPDILLVGVWVGGERMTPASGQETRESSEQPGKEGLPVERTVPYLSPLHVGQKQKRWARITLETTDQT